MNFVTLLTSGLEFIKRFNRSQKILKPGSEYIIDEMIGQINLTNSKYLEAKRLRSADPPSWGYAASFSHPVKFNNVNVDGYLYEPDIVCNIAWLDEPIPVRQDVLLRVWSSDEKLIFRKDVDPDCIYENLTKPDSSGQRVMLRCHFDLANKDQQGPRYHLQFGGNSRDDEYHWYPKMISIPRLSFPPTDFFLLFQIVLRNYFPEKYDVLKDESIWKSVIRGVQTAMLKSYFEDCLKHINEDNILIDEMWNTK
jgi:hypothetical protein